MSLYSDLNEVLTPYAQRIKGLKADLWANENEITNIFTDYEVGGTRSEDGVDNSIGKSVRLPLTNPDDIYHVHIANGYQAYLFSYGANGSYLGRTNLGKVGLDVNGAYLKALKENTTAVKITVYNLSMSDDFTISEFIATGSYIRIRYLDKLKLTVFSSSADISAIKNNSAIFYDGYHQGAVNMESGQIAGTTKSVRTDAINVESIARLYIPEGYQSYLFSYDSEGDYLGRTSLGKSGVDKTGEELKAYKDNTDTIIVTVYNLVMSDDFNVQMFLDTGAYMSYYGSIGNEILALKGNIKSVEEKATEENTEVEQLVCNDMYYADGKIRRCYNPYKNGGSRLLIGQLHCHDEGWNQSETAPELYDTASHEETMQNYKLGGYHFVALTNYSYFPITHVDDADMPSDLTWLCDSAEVPFYAGEDDDGLREKIKHIVELNINSVDGWRDFVPLKDLPDTEKSNGAILSIAHPYWTNTYITPESLAKVRGRIRFVEVWDGLTEYHRERGDGAPNYVTYPSGKGSDYAFEKMLDMGLVTWALAISDVHSGLYTNGIFKRGCVKVFANNNNRLEILKGLCSGNFYASSNVETSISSVSFTDGVYSITTGSATATTKFLKENGEVLKTVTGNIAEYMLDGTEKYVRAVVYFDTGNVDYANEPIYEKVWTQPIINIFNPDYDNYFDYSLVN